MKLFTWCRIIDCWSFPSQKMLIALLSSYLHCFYNNNKKKEFYFLYLEPLYKTCLFSLDAFKISLTIVLSGLIVIFSGVYMHFLSFGFCQASWTCGFKFHQFGKFSVIISSSFFSFFSSLFFSETSTNISGHSKSCNSLMVCLFFNFFSVFISF